MENAISAGLGIWSRAFSVNIKLKNCRGAQRIYSKYKTYKLIYSCMPYMVKDGNSRELEAHSLEFGMESWESIL